MITINCYDPLSVNDDTAGELESQNVQYYSGKDTILRNL